MVSVDKTNELSLASLIEFTTGEELRPDLRQQLISRTPAVLVCCPQEQLIIRLERMAKRDKLSSETIAKELIKAAGSAYRSANIPDCLKKVPVYRTR